MENFSRLQQQYTLASVEKTDGDFCEFELGETVIPGHAKRNVAAGETTNEEYTPQNQQNEIPEVGMGDKLSRSINPITGKEKCKGFSKSSSRAEKPVSEENRQESVTQLREKSTRVRSLPKGFGDFFFFDHHDDNCEDDLVLILEGSEW